MIKTLYYYAVALYAITQLVKTDSSQQYLQDLGSLMPQNINEERDNLVDLVEKIS